MLSGEANEPFKLSHHESSIIKYPIHQDGSIIGDQWQLYSIVVRQIHAAYRTPRNPDDSVAECPESTMSIHRRMIVLTAVMNRLLPIIENKLDADIAEFLDGKGTTQ